MEQLLLKESKVLIAGQLKTSRTEDLESYLKSRVSTFAVIGFMSPFASYNESRCTLYEDGQKKEEFKLFSFRGKIAGRIIQPLMFVSFAVFTGSFFKAIARLRLKFDYFIGIATFSTTLGLWLKKLGRVDKVIYYCLDYYPKPKNKGFHYFVNILFRRLDAWIIRNADVIWSISPRIKEARQIYAGIKPSSYKDIVVPLGYRQGIERGLDLSEREPFSLGFVGTISQNQGLDLVAEGIKELKRDFPEIKAHIIGDGPYANDIKDKVKALGLEKNFIFHGFVRQDKEVYNILSRCMAGLATWTGGEDDMSIYADPGKPKLYALLGLPIVITSAPYVSELIAQTGAGEVIEYKPDDFARAVKKIISDFKNYQQGLERFRPHCLAKKAFDEAFNIR